MASLRATIDLLRRGPGVVPQILDALDREPKSPDLRYLDVIFGSFAEENLELICEGFLSDKVSTYVMAMLGERVFDTLRTALESGCAVSAAYAIAEMGDEVDISPLKESIVRGIARVPDYSCELHPFALCLKRIHIAQEKLCHASETASAIAAGGV